MLSSDADREAKSTSSRALGPALITGAPTNFSVTTFWQQTISLINSGDWRVRHCATTTLVSPLVGLFSSRVYTPRKLFSSFQKSGGAWSTTVPPPALRCPPERSCRENLRRQSAPNQSSTQLASF